MIIRILLSGIGRAAVIAAVSLVAGTALADRPPWAGTPADGARDGERYDRRYDRRSYDTRDYGRQQRRADDYGYGGPLIEFRFDDHSRGAIREYYGERFRQGHCPPGLAKRHGGCIPPGHARHWQRGQPLPPGIAYYSVPPAVLSRLPPPPPRHRYVRVASDILLIAIGSAIVIDAVEDIGQ